MRRKDPFGAYRTDPEDPRLMVRIKPGEKGEWTLLGDEGIDNDGDGRLGEDGEGYVDGNRNWGSNWAPPYVQTGSGDYPFEAAGTRAIAKFLMDRPNIDYPFRPDARIASLYRQHHRRVRLPQRRGMYLGGRARRRANR